MIKITEDQLAYICRRVIAMKFPDSVKYDQIQVQRDLWAKNIASSLIMDDNLSGDGDGITFEIAQEARERSEVR